MISLCVNSAVLGNTATLLVVDLNVCNIYNSETCLKWPLKMEKTKVLKTNGSLMKVESIWSSFCVALYAGLNFSVLEGHYVLS